MNIPEHLFVGVGGSLHDTREPDWSSKVLRTNYQRTYSVINSVEALKATLRAGEYAWPGGYQMFFVTSDGAVLSFDAVRAEFAQCVWSIQNNVDDGWRVIACDINYEDNDLYCAHTGEKIPAAYGD